MTDVMMDPATKAPALEFHRDRGIPASWYRIAWSQEVRPDTLLDLHYFGADLICFRTSSGEVRVFDARCAHLGAHLGDGCLVDGEVVCPFHGWKWNSDGENTLVPYADRPTRQRLRPWRTCEANGMVFVWYDPDGNAPTWTVPSYPQYADDTYLDFYPDYCDEWRTATVHPQQLPENTADPAHITFVHHAAEVPEVERFESAGPKFTVELNYTWGGEKARTWLTPDGPVRGGLVAESWGLGFIATTFKGIHPTLQFTGATPIDSTGSTSHVFTAIVVGKGQTGDLSGAQFASRLARHFFEQVEADLPIWARQSYIEHPPFPKLEARCYRTLRAWADGFYGVAR